MNNLKDLVEKIIDYTTTWSINETEWFYNVDSTRKNAYGEEYITDDEFQAAIREEILYDLIFKNGRVTKNQIQDDLCTYEDQRLIDDVKTLEKEIKKVIKEFKIEY